MSVVLPLTKPFLLTAMHSINTRSSCAHPKQSLHDEVCLIRHSTLRNLPTALVNTYKVGGSYHKWHVMTRIRPKKDNRISFPLLSHTHDTLSLAFATFCRFVFIIACHGSCILYSLPPDCFFLAPSCSLVRCRWCHNYPQSYNRGTASTPRILHIIAVRSSIRPVHSGSAAIPAGKPVA